MAAERIKSSDLVNRHYTGKKGHNQKHKEKSHYERDEHGNLYTAFDDDEEVINHIFYPDAVGWRSEW